MTRYFSLQHLVFALAFIVLIIGFSAFGQQDGGKPDSFRKSKQSGVDSTSSRQLNRTGSIYRVDGLEEEMKKIDEDMKKLEVDMKKLDFSKMEKEVKESMQKVDWHKINEAINQSLVAINKLDMKDIQQDLQRVKTELSKQKFDFSAAKIDAASIRKEINEAMKNARVSVEEAKKELQLSKELIDVLHKDGVINKTAIESVEVREGQLYINGRQQSRATSEKYKSYYRRQNRHVLVDQRKEEVK